MSNFISQLKRHHWRWLGLFFLGYLGWILGKGILASIIASYLTSILDIKEYTMMIRSILGCIIGVGLLCLLYTRFMKNSFHHFGLNKSLVLKESLLGVAVAVLFSGVAIFVILPLSGPENETVVAASKLVHDTPLINILTAGVFLGGIAEEMFYRAHIITSISNINKDSKYLLWFSVLVSATLFGLGHSYQGTLGIIFTFVVSFAYALLFVKRKSITSAMVAHGLYDVIVAIALKYFVFL